MKLWKLRYLTTLSGGTWLVGILFFLLYAFTAPRVNVGYSDSDQFMAVAYNWGVAHPPGYPIYISLLWVMMHLPLPITPAYAGHLLSGIFGALTLMIMFRTTWKVMRTLRSFAQTPLISTRIDTWMISFGSVAALGVSSLFWLYSMVAEVFSLNAFFASLLIYRMVISLTSSRPQMGRWWVFSAFLFGLGLSHHQTLILLFPAWLVSVFFSRKDITIHTMIRMLTALVLGFVLPFGLLLGMARSGAPISWQMADGMPGLVKHIFRQSFTGVIPETGAETNAYLPKIDFDAIVQFLPTYTRESMRFLGIVPLLIALLGIKMLSDTKGKLLTVLLVGWVISGPIFAGILGWPNHFGSQANIQRQTLMGYVFLPVFIGAGWFFLMTRLRKAGEILSNRKTVGGWVAVVIVVGSIGWHFFSTYPSMNMKDFRAFYEEYEQMLSEFSDNAMVVCFTDPSCFMLHYAQAVEHKRPDVIVIPRAQQLVAEQIKSHSDLRKFSYTQEPFVTFDYITWNLGKRPVYVVDMSELYYHLLGVDQAFTYYIPHSYYGELTRVIPENVVIPRYDIAEKMETMPITLNDRMRLYYLSNVSRIHQLNSTLFIKMGKRSLAREELNVAGNLNEKIEALTHLDISFEQARRDIESSQPDPRYQPQSSPISLKEIQNLVPQWKEKRRLDVAHKLALAAITIYPENIEARLMAASSFKEIGDKVAAKEEYQNVLILDENNTIARQALDELNKDPRAGAIQY